MKFKSLIKTVEPSQLIVLANGTSKQPRNANFFEREFERSSRIVTGEENVRRIGINHKGELVVWLAQK